MKTRYANSFGGKSTQGIGRRLLIPLIGALFALACILPFFSAEPGETPTFPGPAVTIHEPAPGAQFAKGDSFVFSASASDAAGVIRLDLWVDGTLVLSQSSPDANGLNPLSLSYPMVAAEKGSYALIARAFNSRAEMGESVAHYVTVVEPPASAPTQQYAQYVVQAGDTLENIAARLGVSVDDILRANPGLSAGQQLQPGQVLIIPMPKQPAVAAAPGPNGVQPVSVPGGGQPGGQPGGGQPGPAPNPPPPASQPSLAIKGLGVVTSPVFYGQSCAAEPQATDVIAAIEPPGAVKTAVVNYAYYGKAGSSPVLTVPMTFGGGSNFGAVINAGGEAAQYLAQDGGFAVVWVEVVDAGGQTSVSQSVTLIVNFCPSAGGQQGNLPGILPQFLPGVPQQNPGIANVNPSLFPAPGNQVFNPPNSNLTAPQNVKAAADPPECRINVDWSDVQNETAYRVDRYEFGKPNPKTMANLSANATHFNDDSLPQPGKYGYRVTAIQGQVSAPSAIVWVELPSSEKCKPKADFKRVFFQAVHFQAAQSQAFVQVTIGDLPTIRVPRGERTQFTVGDLEKQNLTFSAPAPEQIYSQPGASLYVQVHGDGVVPNQPPVDLGKFAASHTALDLTAPNAKDQTWVGEGSGFKLAYKIWLEDWLWNGQASNPNLPAPTNLKLNSSDPAKRVLTWDYDPASLKLIDGFTVHRQYTCQGGDVIAKLPTAVSKLSQRAEIVPQNEPIGCACQFQVSAFGGGGESAPSAPQQESCTTAAPVDSVYVTFESLRTYPGLIPNAGSAASDIHLSVNEFGRKSNTAIIENDRAYRLDAIAFNGLVNNNVVTALIGPGQSPALTISYSLPGLCQGSGVLKKSGNDWTGPGENKYRLTSTNGQCELVFSLKNVPSQGGGAPVAPVAPNQPAPAPAGFGPGCPGNEGCSITFVNQTGFDIVKLDITRKSNGVVENPIANSGLVIPANGGSLVIKEFFDENYTYQASYGNWPQGAQAPTITGSGPVSAVFPGTAKAVNIHDPNAQNPDAQLLRRFLGKSLPWELGAACSLDFGGYCSVRLTFAEDGTFAYEEKPNAISPFMPVATGRYTMISHNPSLQLFLVRLVSDNAAVTFPKDAVFAYGSAIFGVEIKSQRFGALTFCSGACPQWVQP